MQGGGSGRPSASNYLATQQINAAIAGTANSSMSEIKGKPQAPPMTIKPKTKKSMGAILNSPTRLTKKNKNSESLISAMHTGSNAQ